MNYDMKCQLLAEGYKQEQLEEGAFETKVNAIKSGLSIDKEMKKLGLGYNGGDIVYTTKKKDASIVSWGCTPKMIEFLKANGSLTTPVGNGNEYFLEYNLRTRKFQLLRLLNKPGEKLKWFNPVTINGAIEQTPTFKRIAEIAPQFKRNQQTGMDYRQDWGSVARYAKPRKLFEGVEIGAAKQGKKYRDNFEQLKKLGFSEIEFFPMGYGKKDRYDEAFLTPKNFGLKEYYEKWAINLRTGKAKLLRSRTPDGEDYRTYDITSRVTPELLKLCREMKHNNQKNYRDDVDVFRNRTLPGYEKLDTEAIDSKYHNPKYNELYDAETKANREYFSTEYKQGIKGPKYDAWKKAAKEKSDYEKIIDKHMNGKRKAIKNQEAKNAKIVGDENYFNY